MTIVETARLAPLERLGRAAVEQGCAQWWSSSRQRGIGEVALESIGGLSCKVALWVSSRGVETESVSWTIVSVVGWATFALVLGTFVEYWGHRIMHQGKLLGKHHARHHQEGTGQGWLGEFRDYALPGLPLYLLAWWLGPDVGLGFSMGGIAYAAFAAYSHQLQHEAPHLVWWMVQPSHAVHHYHREWHHNFGITVAWWDRVFGTYRPHEPLPRLSDNDARLNIHWVSRSAALPDKRKKRA